MHGTPWQDLARLGLSDVSPFARKIDEAEAAFHAAVDELLTALRPNRLAGNADTAAGRVLADVAALRRMLETDDPTGGAFEQRSQLGCRRHH